MPYKPTEEMRSSIERCGARLGCGLCTFTNRPCPFYFDFGQPTSGQPIKITYEAEGNPYVVEYRSATEMK